MPADHALVADQPEEAADARKGRRRFRERTSWRVIVLCAFVANTGLFHGYDNGVVSDVFTMPSFREMMGWPAKDDGNVAFMKGLTVNGFNAGAAVSAVLSGHLIVDRYGRRPALLLGSVLFALGGLVQATAWSAVSLVAGRLIAGVGVGTTSCAGPAYIAEVAPASIRGAMVGIYQSNVCLAILAASVLNYYDHGMEIGWRISLGVQTALGLATAIGLAFVGDTPRFLESVGRSDEALRILTRLRDGDGAAASAELATVRAELEEERIAGNATWGEVCGSAHLRNVVLLGCAVQLFQIMTGINAIVSFGGTLFESVGAVGLASAVTPSISFFIGNAIGSFGLVDRAGRRALLILGMAGMAASLLVAGAVALASDTGGGHLPPGAGRVVVAMVVGYMFCFGISWGFGAWLYISEIMPLRVRGKAVGLCTGVNWGPANVTSAFITPAMIAGPMGPGGTLLFFGAFSALVVPFAVLCLPETRGRTLEEIVPMFRFSRWSDFRQFVAGNLRDGTGMGMDAVVNSDSEETSTGSGGSSNEEESE